MRGLMSDVGNWNARFFGLTTCGGARQGVPATPQITPEEVTTNWVALTPVMLVWLKMLKASVISCTLRRSLTGMFFVTRGSSETVRAKLKVSRPRPGTRSVRRLESLFRSEPNTAEYGWPDCAVKIPLSCQPPRNARER